MHLNRRKFLCFSTATVVASPVWPLLAQTPSYPAHPMTMVVPFAAGGPTDAVARIVTGRVATLLGQPFVIENVSGADGVIGVGRVARSQADGYTLLTGQLGSNVLNGAVYKLPFDLLNDFEPISLLSSNPYVLVVRKDIPASNLAEFVVWMKANQGKVSMGVSSTVQRVSGALFQKLTGTQFTSVPYRGAGLVLQDVVAGQVDFTFDQPSNMLAQLRAGNIKAFVVTSKKRIVSAPDVPSNDDAGLPSLNISGWNAIWAPKNTPPDITNKLRAAIIEALGDASVAKQLSELGQDIPTSDQLQPRALADFQKSEIEKWWPIVRDAGIKVE